MDKPKHQKSLCLRMQIVGSLNNQTALSTLGLRALGCGEKTVVR